MTVWSYFCFFMLSLHRHTYRRHMEKQRFERVQQTFNYTPGSIFTNRLSGLAFGAGMIVVPLIYHFGLRSRKASILSPDLFTTLFVIAGILLLLFTFFNMWIAYRLIAQGGRITVDGARVTYPVVRKRKVEYDSFLISDIRKIEDDEEEHQCNVDLPDKYIVFETEYFDSRAHYDAFRDLLG